MAELWAEGTASFQSQAGAIAVLQYIKKFPREASSRRPVTIEVERRLSNIAIAAHGAGVVGTPYVDGGILRAHGNPSGPQGIDRVMGRFNRTRV